MRLHGRTISMLGMLVLTASLMPCGGRAGAETVKINGPLVSGGSVRGNPQITPDGSRVLYRADADTAEVDELYSVPIGGGTVLKLNGPLVSGGKVRRFEVSADGSRVVYQADQDTDRVDEFYSVPIGGGTITKLNGHMNDDISVGHFVLTPDGSRVLYHTDQDTANVNELYSVPIGGGTVTKLNDPLLGFGSVLNHGVSADGSRVVYKGRHDPDPDPGPDPDGCPEGLCDTQVDELYSVAVTGGTVTKLNDTLPDWGDVRGFSISSDSTRVVYRAEQDTHRINELYSVPIGGGTIVRLNDPLVSGGQVGTFVISADGSRVVYSADQDTEGVTELYSVPIGGGTVTKLSGDGVYGQFVISGDSSRVVYRAGERELYSVPLDGGVPTRLSPPLVSGGYIGAVLISPDSSRVVYRAQQDTDNVNELYSVPIGGGTVVKLNAPLVNGGDLALSSLGVRFTPDSGLVLYVADQDIDGMSELYSVPAGGGTVTKLNNPFGIGGGVSLWDITFALDSSRVVFVARQNGVAEKELYSSTLPTPPDPDNVYVDFEYGGAGVGTLEDPFDTLVEGIALANAGATIHFVPGTSSETFTGASAISKALYLFNDNPGGGTVRIGGSPARATPKSGFISPGRTEKESM